MQPRIGCHLFKAIGSLQQEWSNLYTVAVYCTVNDDFACKREDAAIAHVQVQQPFPRTTIHRTPVGVHDIMIFPQRNQQL